MHTEVAKFHDFYLPYGSDEDVKQVKTPVISHNRRNNAPSPEQKSGQKTMLSASVEACGNVEIEIEWIQTSNISAMELGRPRDV